MKATPFMTALLSTCLMTSATATSLKLSSDIDILIIDGKKMSGPILQGADSLELNSGQHQILFKISKKSPLSKELLQSYYSTMLIVTFNATDIQTVSFLLPDPRSISHGQYEIKNDNNTFYYQLVNENGMAISNQHDVLRYNALNCSDSDNINLVQIMTRYNLSARKASVPAFAVSATTKNNLNYQ